MTHNPDTPARSNRWLVPAVFILPVAAVVWAHWTTFGEMADRWSRDPQYSHGYLVPVFALALLWLRREWLPSWPLTASWWGLLLLALGIGLRLYGAYFYYVSMDQVAFVPCLAGVWLLVGGWASLRWAWPALLFLLFMVPLPHRYSVMMAEPLQRFATITSTFCLQTLGLPALAEGNVILLNHQALNIVEACSGLRMLVIFFALSTGVALVMRRPVWEKFFIGASAVPIALVVNVLRITVTGVLHETVGSEIANAVFHDLAGWLMMPLALLLLWLELKLLRNLLLDPPAAGHVPVRLTRRQPAAQPAAVAATQPVEVEPALSRRARRRAARLATRPTGQA
jgi:exosortase